MRRILVLLTVAAVMAVMMVVIPIGIPRKRRARCTCNSHRHHNSSYRKQQEDASHSASSPFSKTKEDTNLERTLHASLNLSRTSLGGFLLQCYPKMHPASKRWVKGQ